MRTELPKSPPKEGIQGNVGITDTARAANKHPADSMLRPSDKGALKNIIDNACKYSDKEVNVALYREQQQVILEVEDQGIGIPQEEIEHIFQSFYRGSNTRDYAGQGIGLSLTLKIISAYHAKLDISSEIEKGTKVRVIF